MWTYIQRFDADGDALPEWGPYGSKGEAETYWGTVEHEFPGVRVEYIEREKR